MRKIRVAPDDRLIEVELAIDRDRAHALDLAHPPPDLRTQVVIYGLTGVTGMAAGGGRRKRR